MAPEGIEPPFPGCGPGVIAIGPRGREQCSRMDSNHRPLLRQNSELTGCSTRASILLVGLEPTASALSERRALRCSTGVALPTGLEPVLSTVTEWRPLQLVHGSVRTGAEGTGVE